MALDDSDDEGDYNADDLDDAYSFDSEIVAQMVKEGRTSQPQIIEAMKEAMAAALERRLRLAECGHAVEPGADNPYANMHYGATCEDDIGGRMTPPAPSTPTGCMFDCSPDAAVEERMRMAQARASAKARTVSRRSSIVRRDAISQAMQDAVSRHRRSIVTKVTATDRPAELIQQAMASAHRRHRMSVAKAAEVVEAAEPDNEQEAMEDNKRVAEQMHNMQQALEQARAGHRRCIAEAVKCVTNDTAAATAAASPDTVQDRIQKAIAASYQRRCGGSVAALTSQQSAQEQIQQAMAAARQRSGVTSAYTQPTSCADESAYGQPTSGAAEAWHDQSCYTDASQCYAGASQLETHSEVTSQQCYTTTTPSWNGQQQQQPQHQQQQQSYADASQCYAGASQWETHSEVTSQQCYTTTTPAWNGQQQQQQQQPHQLMHQQQCYAGTPQWSDASSMAHYAEAQAQTPWQVQPQPQKSPYVDQSQCYSGTTWAGDARSDNAAWGNDGWSQQTPGGNWGCEAYPAQTPAAPVHWTPAWGSA